jgi:peptide deformylase
LQHEIDHLNGILFIDRASEITQGQDILDQLKAKI